MRHQTWGASFRGVRPKDEVDMVAPIPPAAVRHLTRKAPSAGAGINCDPAHAHHSRSLVGREPLVFCVGWSRRRGGRQVSSGCVFRGLSRVSVGEYLGTSQDGTLMALGEVPTANHLRDGRQVHAEDVSGVLCAYPLAHTSTVTSDGPVAFVIHRLTTPALSATLGCRLTRPGAGVSRLGLLHGVLLRQGGQQPVQGVGGFEHGGQVCSMRPPELLDGADLLGAQL
jgi:hypothetical protein